MNFVGHIEVARALSPGRDPSSDLLLGAALPDLAAMGRFRLTGRPENLDISRGVKLHHRTDDAFHSHRLFRSTSDAASSTLTEAGLSRGAALACGHVGIELLLDGHLLTERAALRPAVTAAIATAGERVDELTPLVDPARQDDWRRHLKRLAEWPIPDDYHQPVAVAGRLKRILDHRPRLAFSAAEIDMVAEGLASQHLAVNAGASALIDDLSRSLTDLD